MLPGQVHEDVTKPSPRRCCRAKFKKMMPSLPSQVQDGATATPEYDAAIGP